MTLRVRTMEAEETNTIRRLAHARTESARTGERARIVWLPSQGRRVPAITQELELTLTKVRSWLKRFNRLGQQGLQEQPRGGRPATYTPAKVRVVVATSLTRPRALGLPFAGWTLDRLQAYLQEVKGLPIKRTRIGERLLAEGLRWRQQETWFGERVDPAFAEKGDHHDALCGAAPREWRRVSG
jgi:transposase